MTDEIKLEDGEPEEPEEAETDEGVAVDDDIEDFEG